MAARIAGLILRASNKKTTAEFYQALGIELSEHAHGGPKHFEMSPYAPDLVFELYQLSHNFSEDALMVEVDSLSETLRECEKQGIFPVFPTDEIKEAGVYSLCTLWTLTLAPSCCLKSSSPLSSGLFLLLQELVNASGKRSATMRCVHMLIELKTRIFAEIADWWGALFSKEKRTRRALRNFVRQYYASMLALERTPLGRWMQKWREEVTGESVLDIGCGPQLFDDAVSFGNMPKEVVGMDANEATIEFLRTSTHSRVLKSKHILETQGVKVDFFVHDVRTEEEKYKGHFNTIFASGVMGIFTEDEVSHVLRVLRGYLVPGGTCVILSYDEPSFSKARLATLDEYQWCSGTDTGRTMIVRGLEAEGFTILKTDTYKISNPRRFGWGVVYGIVAQK